MKTSAWMAAMLLLPAGLPADQVTLKNGDRLSGEILVVDASSVVLKTEFLGEVKINRAGVAAIETDRPLSVTLKTGERLEGELAVQESAARVRKPDRSEMSVPVESLEAARTRELQAAWEREQRRRTNPPLLDF